MKRLIIKNIDLVDIKFYTKTRMDLSNFFSIQHISLNNYEYHWKVNYNLIYNYKYNVFMYKKYYICG